MQKIPYGWGGFALLAISLIPYAQISLDTYRGVMTLNCDNADCINRLFANCKGGNLISGRGSAISSAKEGKSGFI